MEAAASEAHRTWKSIIVYLCLTAVLSSIFYFAIIHRTTANKSSGLLILGLMWSPGVSGLITALAFQGNLQGIGFKLGPAKYLFASYWIPLLYSAVVYVPLWVAGYRDANSPLQVIVMHRFPNLSPAAASLALFLFLATAGVIGSCISAMGEELGWRGFLVPQLAKVSSFPRVALISGGIWALWHFPLILFADYHGAGPLWYSVVCFAVMVMGISFLFAWMRLKSGSVWTGVLLHASHNLFVQAWFDAQTRKARVTGLGTTEFGAGLAIAAVVVAIVFHARQGELPAASV